jgi:SAM-dependent methyltransferase
MPRARSRIAWANMWTLPDWLSRLRRAEIVDAINPVREGDYFYGIHKDEIFNHVIGGGQAAFDAPYGHLTSKNRVLLYAYLNQLGHIEELGEAFTQLFGNSPPTDPLIVLDLGCGPFTGGLALAAVFGRTVPFTYIGVDSSSAMRDFGERLACAAERAGEISCTGRQWVENLAAIGWTAAPGWPRILVIASYLLASPTLDAEILVADLDKACDRFGRGSVTVLYTNSPNAGPNRSFGAFRAALERIGFAVKADDLGAITVDRLQGVKDRKLRYALFHRDAKRVLEV